MPVYADVSLSASRLAVSVTPQMHRHDLIPQVSAPEQPLHRKAAMMLKERTQAQEREQKLRQARSQFFKSQQMKLDLKSSLQRDAQVKERKEKAMRDEEFAQMLLPSFG